MVYTFGWLHFIVLYLCFLYGSLCLGSLAVEFFEINDCAVYFSYPNETFLITNTSVYETMRDNCGIVKG